MATNFKDFLGNKDVKWWDGVVRAFTRRISTGALIALNKIGNSVDVVEAYGAGTGYNDVSLNAALAAVGSNKCIFVLQPGAWAVSNNVTLPATVTLKVPHGAEITIASGKTLTINGPIVAGAYEIFKGTGTLAGSPLLQYWDPTWINGTVTDSTTKSYKALTLGNLSTGTLASGTQTVTGNVAISGTLASGTQTVTGNVAISGTLANGNQTTTGNVAISGTLANGNQTTTGTCSISGALTAGSFNLLPAGVISMYGAAAAPTGWLLCDGSQVSRTTYATLYAVVGDTFGAGDGSTTFNVPNMKGRAPVGVGQGNTAEGGGAGTDRVLAATGGAENHTLTTDEMPAHTHTVTNDGTTGNFQGGGTGALVPAAGNTGSTGGGTAHNNMTPFLTVNFIIKT